MASLGARLGSWLFPSPPRQLPGRRPLKIALRSAHVLTAAVLVGAHVLSVDPSRAGPWLHATMLSGLLLLLLDLHESAAFLLQVRGLVVLAKLATLAALPHLNGYTGWVLAALLVVSVVSSHAAGSVRYFVVAGRSRVTGARSKG